MINIIRLLVFNLQKVILHHCYKKKYVAKVHYKDRALWRRQLWTLSRQFVVGKAYGIGPSVKVEKYHRDMSRRYSTASPNNMSSAKDRRD